MSTGVLDERAHHLALVRAQAALIADSSRPVRRLVLSPGTKLASSPRKRRHARRGPPPQPRVARWHLSWRRRLIAAAALTLQVGLLVLALTLPGFQVRQVTVVGTHLITTGAVVAAAEVPEQSIFTINGAAIQGRVQALPWVASAVVTTELPATVQISVVERTPMLRIRRDGADTLVASDGATLPGADATPAARTGIPVLIDDRIGSPQPVNPTLVELLSSIARRFPPVFGCSVVAYLWGADDVVSLWTSTGWRAILGHLDTQDSLRGLPALDRNARSAQGSGEFRQTELRLHRYRSTGVPGERRSSGPPCRGDGGAASGRSGDPAAAGGLLSGAADGTPHGPPDADAIGNPDREPVIRDHPDHAGGHNAETVAVAGLADAIPGARGAQRGEDRPGRG